MAGVTKPPSHFALPAPENLEICQILGLALNNISMYGMAHSVTATSVAQAYDCFVGKLDLYGAIEFVYSEAGLLINGVAVETERSTGKLLVDQLVRLKIHDFELSSPISRPEFGRFMSVLASTPGSPEVADGFEAAIAKLGLKSVRVANVSYARVDKDKPLVPDEGSKGKGGGFSGAGLGSSSSGGAKSFDLDFDLGGDDFMFSSDSSLGGPNLAVTAAASSYIEQKRAADAERNSLLAMIRDAGKDPEALQALRQQLLEAGLTSREWDDLLVSSGALAAGGNAEQHETLNQLMASVDLLAAEGAALASGGKSTDKMGSILDGIGAAVVRLASQTTGHVDTLAGKVDADRDVVAKLEADARSHGLGLKLSREELLGNLAEINQELAQPLTATSAVIDMLAGGQLGAVSDAQRDVLKVASEGMERLEGLIKYLTRISGMPSDLSPDRQVLNDAYGVSEP